MMPFSYAPLRCSRATGFTLVEMVVVLAVVAILIGAVGLGLSGGDQTIGLQNAQALVSSMVTSARGQAALQQRDAAIMVWHDPDDPDVHLRQLAILVSTETSGSGSATGLWHPVGEPVRLPESIFFVPPDADETSSKTEFAIDVDWEASSGLDRVSSPNHYTSATTAVTIKRDLLGDGPGVGNTDDDDTFQGYIVCTFTPRSTLGTTNPVEIVLAPGQPQGDGSIIFANAFSIRGLRLSAYGIATLINDYDGFDPK